MNSRFSHKDQACQPSTKKWYLSVLAILFSSSFLQAQRLEYNRDVRPILADNCFACHGPDSASRKKDLRLDRSEDAIKAEAIVPGKPEMSEMIVRIFSEDDSDVMPPPKTKKKLTSQQKETLKKWVAQGAEYQQHWSLITPKRPTPPQVKNEKWVRNPIDRFILAALEKKGLQPAPEADRRTLARRLSLDITGLPPEPSDVEAFVNDKSSDAYEKYIEKLMKSPQWGEHRGRYWLDVARYADTHGIHFDNFREVWSYRDWVIKALNKNMPFDQFTIEQLAGDLLPNRTLDQQIATGFNRCNITTNEGGVIPEEYLVLYTRDRTETTSQVWLGMTTGCAVCHDHKFDPISQKEFYQLAAFFNNTTQGAMDGNIPNTPPISFVPKPEDRPRWEALAKEIELAKKQTDSRKQTAKSNFDQWVKDAKADLITNRIPADQLLFQAKLNEGTGKEIKLDVAGKPRTVQHESGFEWIKNKEQTSAFVVRPGPSIEVPEVGDFERDQSFSVGGWVKIPKRGQFGALLSRMTSANGYRGWDLWMENDRVGMHIINKWDNNALKAVAKTPLQPNKWYHVLVTYDGSSKASGIRVYLNGKQEPTDITADSLNASIRTTVPLKVGQRNEGERLQGVSLKDLRLYSRLLGQQDVQNLARAPRVIEILEKPTDKRTAPETNELFDWWLQSLDSEYIALAEKVEKLQKEEVDLKSRGTIAHVMQERSEEAMAFILFRGEYDRRKDPVKPLTPTALPKMPDNLPKNRLGFAKWLLQPDHPLTTRVTVNRFWQEIFGNGIVRTAGDFGVAGELPTHPELLDWLAIEFREGGWDMKKFYTMIFTSATYRQAANATEEKLEKDAENRYLSRGPRYRMDAEMIRDYALASSGLLVKKLGGPSVKPYQPEGVWEAVAMIGSNTRDYKADSGENLYRRSMYTFWKRSAPPASMEIINAPNRETCTVRRERTNTPLQALVTLNDVQFVEAARFLAEKTLKQGGEKFETQIDFLSKRLLARSFTGDEMKIVRESFDELLAQYKKDPAAAKKLIAVGESKADPKLDASTLAAWTMLANQLMNLDEVLNK